MSPSQLRYPLLHYPHLCYPNLFTVIHNRTTADIVLYRITFPKCGYRGPLWSTLPLTIIIINAQFCIADVSQRNMANPSLEANAFILTYTDRGLK